MARRAKTGLLLRTFKWSARMRERGSDANWFLVEYLAYLDDDGKRALLAGCPFCGSSQCKDLPPQPL